MAQSGFTPIQLYFSTTGAAVPSAGNLANGELAINITDGRLFYKDNGGVVQVIGTKGGVGTSTNTQVLFNSAGAVTGSANMTFDGTALTLTGLNNTGNTTLGNATADTLTVNALVNSNLLFTDATYDIGASGANRPRNLFLSNALTAGGSGSFADTLAVTGTTSGASAIVRTANLNQYSTVQIENTGASGRSWSWGVGGPTAPSFTNQFYLYDNTAGAARIQVLTNGNVGIGQAPVDRLTVSGAVVTTGQTVLSTTEGAIQDYSAGSSEGRLLAYKSTGSAIGFWTNASGNSLQRRAYLDGIGRIQFSSDSGGASAPQGWAATQSVIELGGGGAWNASNTVGGTMSFTSNAYFDASSGWLRRATGYPARLDLLGTDGSATLQTSFGTGAAGSAITWDNSLNLNRSNLLELATTSASLGSTIRVSNPNTNNFSVLSLRNTGASGKEYQIGMGGSAVGLGLSNCLYIYDGSLGQTRFVMNSSGQSNFGSSVSYAKLSVQTSSSNGNVSVWDDGQFVVSPGATNTSGGLGISYDTANNASTLSSLSPGVSWRNMDFRALSYNWYSSSDLVAAIDSTHKQPSTPFRHAFSARNPQGTSQPSGTTLIFTTVPLNQGSRYSAVNGRFTAAVSGLYHFSHTALTFTVTNYFYASFWVNGATAYIAWHTPQIGNDYESYSMSATIYLNAGDFVECVTQYNGGSPRVEGGSFTARTTFSGHFVG